MRKTTPRLVYSPLGGRFYIVLRYTLKEVGGPLLGRRRVRMIAHEKYDATDDVKQALRDQKRRYGRAARAPR